GRPEGSSSAPASSRIGWMRSLPPPAPARSGGWRSSPPGSGAPWSLPPVIQIAALRFMAGRVKIREEAAAVRAAEECRPRSLRGADSPAGRVTIFWKEEAHEKQSNRRVEHRERNPAGAPQTDRPGGARREEERSPGMGPVQQTLTPAARPVRHGLHRPAPGTQTRHRGNKAAQRTVGRGSADRREDRDGGDRFPRLLL